MNATKISRTQIAKLLGVSVSEVIKIHNSLIAKGYIKALNKDGASELTVPDPNIATKMHRNPIKFTL
ncbi:Helix-turn-helix domain protein (plasmid) [Candidatus Trichorickettsia mobilis]|uniref:hypothetical protein n=1 Tax=Candidatus Trichorickettsia mobilis TaxID=1346319 RepID=UPI002B25A060|nr:hypothetical protein [Candidatus Trichorickettsia mobilis]WPY01785.1 Helix-turn-helix domain protein [Candidatus Trichorickettsia mobilis]